MNKAFRFTAIVLILLGAIIGGVFSLLSSSLFIGNGLTKKSIGRDYEEALKVIDKHYVSKFEHEQVLDRSIQEMLWMLDPHSSFFTRKEFRRLNEEQHSRFYGIGVSISQHKDGVYVQSIIPNAPADSGGLRYGDKFVEVDGKDAKKWTTGEVIRNVRGERGTIVKIKVERVNSKSPKEFEIVRGSVPFPSIRNSFMFKNQVGYVGLSGGFQETTAKELDEAVLKLKKRGMRSLILDLRENKGGLLPQAIKIVSRFVPDGKTVVSVKGRSESFYPRDLKSTGGKAYNFPLVVLINGGSASASEIVAGAIQDYKRGLVVGSESFGKGLVQRVFPLPYGTGLTLTTARYYTPSGRSLQRDYSSGSIYDYFTQNKGGHYEKDVDGRSMLDKKSGGKTIKIPSDRISYGGHGITPDLKVPNPVFNDLRYRINESVFFFTRELVAGSIKGFESYKTEKQSFATEILRNDLEINRNLFESYVSHAINNKEIGLAKATIDSQIDYVKSRLRAQIATAKYSNEAGIQALLENDPQVLKAVNILSKRENQIK